MGICIQSTLFPKIMKKLILVVFSFFALFLANSQSRRFVYEVAMNPDSTQLVPMIKERMILSFDKDKSLFISENKLKRDSIFAVNPEAFSKKDEKKGKKKDFGNFPKTNYNYIIEKSGNPAKISFTENIGPQSYSYVEDRPFNWKLSDETDNINGYKVYKATADFAGRKWIAWYTKDITISDGPYKFGGLPGLIVKAEDTKADYIFTLLSEQKNSAPIVLKTNPDTKILNRLDFERQQIIFESKPQDEKQKMFASQKGKGGGSRGGMMGGNSGGFGGGGRGMGGGRGRMGGMGNNTSAEPRSENTSDGLQSQSQTNFEAFKRKNPTTENPIEIGL